LGSFGSSLGRFQFVSPFLSPSVISYQVSLSSATLIIPGGRALPFLLVVKPVIVPKTGDEVTDPGFEGLGLDGPVEIPVMLLF
jgi:hypothetical protein